MRNQKSLHKKRLGLIFTSSILLLTGCGEIKETTDKAVDSVEDVVQSAATSDNPQVISIKESYPEAYPHRTIGEAFESFFSSPKWKHFLSNEDQDVVEFTGYFLYEEVEAKATVQFLLSEDGSFEVGSVSYNDLPQNELAVDALLTTIFEEPGEVDKEMATNASEGTEQNEVASEPDTLDTLFQIGATLTELTNHYGSPTYDDYFMGGRLVVFEEKDGYFLDEAENVSGFMISNPNTSIFGANIGMTFAEINAVLPNSSEIFFDESETQTYVQMYDIEGYKVSFYSETEDGPTTSVIMTVNE